MELFRCLVNVFLMFVWMHTVHAQFGPFSNGGIPPPSNWFNRNGISPFPRSMRPPNIFNRPTPNAFINNVNRPFAPNGFPMSGFPPPLNPFPQNVPNPGTQSLINPQIPTQFSSTFPTPPPISQFTGFPAQRQSLFTTNDAPTLPQTSSAGQLNQPPSNVPAVLTFTPVSDMYQPVTISASDSDSLYTRIKAIFDQAYPNLPPLRRTDERILFQIQKTPNFVESTAVLSNDLSTLYVPYQIPERTEIAYIPFDRSTRELVYPEKPIFLPYPQLSVRIQGRNFPVYLPFHPDESRPADALPQVFIPFQNPPIPIPDYILFLPFVPEVLFSTTTDNQNKPEWDQLRVTWGRNLSDPSILASIPKSESEAQGQGYTMISDCSGSSVFLGRRYIRNQDAALILIYDVNGVIAGVQTGIPYRFQNEYPTQNLIPRPFVPEGNNLFLTMYFIDPSTICSSGRTAADLEAIGVATNLYFQNGMDPIKDSILVPRDETEIQQTMWSRGQCYPGQGVHYGYNIRTDMPCEELVPFHLIYDKGRLKGFAWIFLSSLTSSQNRFEYFDESFYSTIYNPVPQCIAGVRQITSLHLYLVDNPLMHQCS